MMHSHSHPDGGLTREEAINHLEVALPLITTAHGLLACVATDFPMGRDPVIAAAAAAWQHTAEVLHTTMLDVIMTDEVTILSPHEAYLRAIGALANNAEFFITKMLELADFPQEETEVDKAMAEVRDE